MGNAELESVLRGEDSKQFFDGNMMAGAFFSGGNFEENLNRKWSKNLS
jgi:hypothetical protein